MAININANANVNVSVSGEEVIGKLEKEVASLNNRLIETQNELSDVMYEADILRDRLSELEGKDVGILNASLEQFQETARRGAAEIQRMLRAFNVKDAIGNTEFVRDRLLEVEGGVKTVGQAVSEIKNEFRPLFEENYNKSGGLFDTQTVQTFLASLDTVLEKVNEISSQVNLMMKDGVPASGSTGEAYGSTNIIDQIRTSVEGMSEEARAAYQPLTQLVEKVSEFANLDSTRIIGVANAFKGLSGIGDGGYSDKKIANITKLLNTLENADSSKLSALQFNPKGLNELHVRKASLSNLAEYLPKIANVNVSKLKSLSDVDLTNFNNVKVSKASMEAIAQLNEALKELNAVKVAVATETNGGINIDTLTHSSNPIGAVKRQIASTIAEQEDLAYAEWNKIQKEQQRVHDQTIVSWNKVGDAAEKEEQRIERATQREIESHYKAEQASEEAAFRELEARKSAEEKKQSEIAKSLADFETKLQKEEADVIASTQKELDAYLQSEESREAKIEKENEKLFQSHVKTSAQRRELEEQRAHEENEAYQSGLRKAEQAVAKEVELEKQKYQQELDALEEYERAREAKIEKENEKLFQSHVRASQDANLQAKWQSQGLTESNIKSLFGKAKNNKDLFEGIEGGFEGLTERYREVLALHEKYKDKLHDENDPVVKNIENRTKALKEEIEAVLDDAAAKKKTDKTEKDKQSLLGKSAETVSRLRKEYVQWTAAAKGSTSVDYHKLKDFADSIDDLIGQLSRDEISPEEFKRKFDALTSGARQSEAAIKSVGKNTQSLADRIKGLTTKFGAWLSVSQIVMAAVRAVKKMISTAQEIDAAMTQLKIVTNATNNEMKEFSNTAIALAKDLGKSVTELTKSIETFSRLGYSLKDASELAKYATIMSNVAGVSADEATTGLTSIVKGYNLDVSEAEHVADILVDVGQKYAVSAGEMMEAYEKSGAALHATNTTLEKSAGLIASANASVQDSSVVGREMPSFTVM